MYVDASGDDGFKFESNSSSCYAAAALLVKQEDIQHNLDILSQIKQTVGCRLTDEIKYSRIRRHRNGPKALTLLRDIRGKMSCFIVFKKELSPEDRPVSGSKELSVICHLMALQSLNYYSFSESEKILIAIDRMKSTEEVPIENLIKFGFFDNPALPERNFNVDTVFRDSKDVNFLLIQLADLLCGTVREHFEQYETHPDMLYFKSLCPKCQMVQRTKKRSAHNLCRGAKGHVNSIINSKNLHNIIHLIPKRSTTGMLDFFFMKPAKMIDQHFYLMCKRI